ncbi:MAG: SUMF1/EgtB/PvdO family nonheme iron enzyme [Myxococcales bacterium]|nr:SUMF1/EgtB/PvdO family nonheme iron enzyme [Myxococcales bacterium]
MSRSWSLSIVLAASLLSSVAFAGSVGTPSGCKKLKGERAACEKCVAGGNFYQPGQGCGMVEGMHASKAFATEKPPPRPTSMPKTGKDYVTIAPGSFEIGARERDPDKDDGKEVFESTVTLTRPFLMKTTEVTQGEYLFIVGEVTTSYDKKCGLDCPANALSWSNAVVYLNLLSKKEGLEPCYAIKGGLATWTKGYDCTGYRLPTEAEWEYAARGGNEEPRYGEIDEIAWYSENSSSSVHPVGKKKKNAYGLYDMLGNVWEWTWDAMDYKPYTENMTDTIIGGLSQESEGQDRVVRGGGYSDSAAYVRASHRYQYPAGSGGSTYGFRPVRTAPAK